MPDLPKGYTIQTKNFNKVTVAQKLGEGGQGAVYRVDYNGQAKALKWYSGKKLKSPDKFYANLENNIKKGRPTKAFLWPEDITEHHGMDFGYVMDLAPDEYKNFSKFVLAETGFESITAMCNASLHITAGFRELHNRGYSYQDLSDGNFFINPKNGDVLICDNDNVSEHGKSSGVDGTTSYMAPEIVAKGAKPDILTDRFSLSVVLFLLWTNNHPLEGKAAYPAFMGTANDRKIYGENPVFIFDPKDKSNIPVKGLHEGALTKWPFLPAYLQEEFVNAFSKDVLKNPSKRIIEQEWLRLFIRMRSEVYKCPCGEVYFADPLKPNPCPGCRNKNKFPMYVKTYRFNLPIHQRTKLYTCHTENDSEDFETLEGTVAANGNGFELKNVSSKNWTVTDGGGTSAVSPNAALTLKKGIKINFGKASAEII